MTDWQPPGPGPWQQDSAHMPDAATATLLELLPPGFNRGFSESFARYGVLLDRLAMGVVNGFTYHQPQPFDLPGPEGPPSPEWIGEEIGRRNALAQSAFENKLWREDLDRWDQKSKPEAVARHRELGSLDLAGTTDEELATHIDDLATHVDSMVYQHHRNNVASFLPVGDFAIHVTAWTGRPPQQALAALGGYSPVSGLCSEEIRPAAEAAGSNTEAVALLTGNGDAHDRLTKLRQAVPAIDEWVETVGYRPIDGFDITATTLIEQPDVLLGKLRAALDADPDATRRGSDELADAIRADVPSDHRDEFDELLAEARALYRLRDERGLYSDVTAFGLMRHALLEVGRRAHDRDLVEEAEHLLDATPAEAKALLAGEGPHASELAARRMHRLRQTAAGAPRHLGPPPPPPPDPSELPPALGRLMGATGFMIEGILGQLENATGGETRVAGVGVGDTVVEGTARVVDELDDLLDIEDGEIIVSASTSEAFNSVLHLVAGLITDHGSYASHAAIVAREMGFPAVVGSVDATKRIKTGDRVRVDGSKGEVTLLG